MISVHANSGSEQIPRSQLSQLNTPSQEAGEQNGELPLGFLKKFVAYARLNCAPRLSEKASHKLVTNYIKLRNPPREEITATSKSRFYWVL